MNIGEASSRSGLTTKTIRHYEDVGLVLPKRDKNGYREFTDGEIHKLAFLARCRSLGFTLNDCRSLFALWEDKGRNSADVKRIACDHLDTINQKVDELSSMMRSLSDLIDTCEGDEKAECAILKNLAS